MTGDTMDTVQFLRWILLACVPLIYGESRSHKGNMSRLFKAFKREKRTHDGNTNRVELGSDVSPRPVRLSSCCENGGTCVMSTFCHCPKGFYGRRCEHRDRSLPCGTIPHGTWLAAACHLCHCYDGRMTCKASRIRNCGQMAFVKGHEQDPEYQVDIEKKSEDYDQFYDDDDDYNSTSDACCLAYCIWLQVILTLIVVSGYS